MKAYRFASLLMALLSTVVAGVAGAETARETAQSLKARYPLSTIEVGNVSNLGVVAKKGLVLRLEADAPALRIRFVQANTKSPRFHVRDYARVEVIGDRIVSVERGDFTLPKGTRVVVLDLKVESDRVQLFTHTVEPLRLPDGKAAYGCTEFVFHFEPSILAQGDVVTVQHQIERWLPRDETSG